MEIILSIIGIVLIVFVLFIITGLFGLGYPFCSEPSLAFWHKVHGAALGVS